VPSIWTRKKETDDATAAANNNKGKKVVDKKNITCFNCQQKGHYVNECPKPKKKTQPSSVANSAMNGTVLMTFPSAMRTKKTWIADSGALSHITNNDTGLYDICEVKELVKSGNGRTVYATEMRKLNVSIGLKDGHHVPFMLNNVQFIPGFWINLFSLRAAIVKGSTILNKG